MSAPPDIFLSYNREDQATARRFAEAFEAQGFEVWWDATLRSGEAYDEVTEKALREAKAVVVLWSKKSVVSRWVRAEATLADRNKTLVPAMIEPCDRPIMFELTQTAELAHWQGAPSDRAWLAFLADVERFIAKDRAPSQVPAQDAKTPSVPPDKPGARGDAPSIAVLPFANRSGLPEDDVFSMGMVEDVIDALSQGVYVRVLASSATAAFRKDALTDLPAIARQLGVRYFLEGNVRRAGTNLRVTAQLVEAASGAILWTQRFDRPLTELAALQEQLVLEVAAHLDTQVFRIEMESALRKPGDLTAWECVMRAIAAHRMMNLANLAVAAEEARRAVAIAPDYGLAQAVLAMTAGFLYFVVTPDDEAEVRRIRGHADRAVALEPNSAFVLANVSLALSCIGYPNEGLRCGERAVRLNPGAAVVHFSCGVACLYLDRADDALAHFEADLKASPGAQSNFLNLSYQTNAHILAGRWSEALAACDRALALYPGFPLALGLKAVICWRDGRQAEARSLFVRTHQRGGTLANWEMNLERHFVNAPIAEEMLRHFRALWADAEPAAGRAPPMTAHIRDAAGAPPPPRVRLCLGVTGHRESNPTYAAHRGQIETVLAQIFELIGAAVTDEPPSPGSGTIAPTRLHCLLADGADQLAATSALARGWELVAPLPFGLALNVAINAHPTTASDASALLAGSGAAFDACSAEVRDRAVRIRELAARARLFELADRDESIAGLFLASLKSPNDARKTATFAAESSLRVALAGRVMIEQSDFLIAIWDGATRALVGGTGHTIQVALETGAPVVWIDANAPERWRILSGPEALAGLHKGSAGDTARIAELQALVRRALRPAAARSTRRRHGSSAGPDTLARETLPVSSNPFWHWYRRIEALFGADSFRARFRNLRQTYETPDAIASGSAAELVGNARALPGQEAAYVERIENSILRRFAWADGVSAKLSDIYRGGMIANFLLAPLAIIGGIAYLPFASSNEKWLFASFELAMLAAILAITLTGQKRRWHGRWFETRRVAEYLRHAPILLLLGVARAPGRWPLGTETSWPEWYSRHVLRDLGLPRLTVRQAYLRNAADKLLHDHVIRQRDYHIVKARRLAAAHHNLDRLSTIMFALAVVSVAGYVVLKAGGVLHLWPKTVAEELSYFFTFLGVLLPTFGGAFASIRYFGDFERFSAISRVTSEKLEAIHTRIAQLLDAPDSALDYGRVADLVHATDDVVVSEIESWQAVFGGKHVTVPV